MSLKSPIKRSRGRPAYAAAQQDAMRLQILTATREAFIQRGYHGLSVELIVVLAGISRPTFYKYFANADEAIDLLLRDLNSTLIDEMTQVTEAACSAKEKLEAALNYWRHWGERQGALLRPSFAELHDIHSPASRYRQQTLAVLAERLSLLIESLGRSRPAAVLIDVFISSVEFLVYRYHLQTPRDECNWQVTRNAILQLVVGLLGDQRDWGSALQVAHALKIDLNSPEIGNDA